MNILGINQVPGMLAWLHDSAAVVIKDGVLVATAEEERFNRVRHARGYPYQAVDYCLKEGGIVKNDVDIIAISQDPYLAFKHLFSGFSVYALARRVANAGIFEYWKKNIKREFKNARVIWIPHHLAHAASAYRCSGFKEANILTVDASGEIETFTFFIGRGNEIKKIWDIKLDGFWGRKKRNSIGLVYSRVTNFLSLGTHGEGKTMGLASYGEPKYDFSSILNLQSHTDYAVDRDKISALYGMVERKNQKDELTQEHKNLAASLQRALEESIFNLAKEVHAFSGIRNFCLAGGVALNCNMNSKIANSDFCDNIFIQPAATDGGTALGAAIEASAMLGASTNFKMEHAYWGPEFSNADIEKFLKETKMRYEFHENIESVAAELLAEGKIVGWFQGRMELGPRALCNRSILADPSVPSMNDRVNNYVKHRESWRPFAPVVTEEDGGKYFENYRPSPFMLLTFYVKKEFRQILPAITHIDGSSRIQTVNRAQNPRCYKLLKEFEKRKKIPVLLNTSFNDQNEPIVATPKDAFRCFASTGLDALVMGNFLVRKI